jgi:phosphoglycolate phosphatase
MKMQTGRAPGKAILYDLDGTLVDHFTAIHRAITHAQRAIGAPPSSYELVRATVGGSIEVTMARLIGPELAPRAIPYYHDFFAQIMFEDLHPLPGAACLLENLHARGLRQAVLTNKQGDTARAVVRHLGWDKWVELVLGTHDTPWRKPMREFVLHAVEKLGVAAEDTLLVGDSTFDIEAAANAGMRCQAVATGSHTRAQLLAHQPAPEAVYENLSDLAAATFGLEPA